MKFGIAVRNMFRIYAMRRQAISFSTFLIYQEKLEVVLGFFPIF